MRKMAMPGRWAWYCSASLFLGVNIDAKPRITGVSLGIGDWITETRGKPTSRQDYFTLPSLSVYAGWEKWNAGLNLPYNGSFLKSLHSTRWAFGGGDAFVGRKLGNFSPRLSVKIPLYDWSVENALLNERYIGSGNVDLGAGLGYGLPPGHLPRGWSTSADLSIATAATRALADYGSTHALAAWNVEYAFANRWKVGVSTLALFDYWKWIPSYWDQKTDTKFSVLPAVLLGVRLGRATYVNAKAGIGVFSARYQVAPKYTGGQEMSQYFNVSVYQGF